MKKKNIFILLVLIILLLTISITLFIIFKNKKSNNTTFPLNNQIINEIDNNFSESDVYVTFNKTNSWTSGNKTFAQFNVNIQNDSNNNFANWKIVSSIPNEFEITQIWNATNTIDSNNLIFTPASYNTNLNSSSSVEFGFIVSSASVIEITNYSLYFNNIEYSKINANSNSNTSESKEIPEQTNDTSTKNTPVEIHGKLSVAGTEIQDQNGNTFSLKGVSTHGLAWFSQYVNQDSFNTMRDSWGINTVRLAMYSNPNDGYNKKMHEIVKKGVKYASDAGLYVIVDWHILNDNNPNMYKSTAIEFFKEMAELYKDYPNVLYEICNEPNGNVTWEKDIKPYATDVITEIRKIDNDAIIIVGTPTWSQDVDIVAKSPLTNVNNVMYSLHFYAATHKQFLRDKMINALNSGLPIFVSEFGICDASGNGYIDEKEANTWIDTLNSNNISWICWNLSNKNESSSLILNSCEKTSNWTESDLSKSGKWLLQALKR